MKDITLYEKVPAIKNNQTVKFMHYHGLIHLLPQWHEHTEMMFIVKGNCCYTCNGNTFEAKENDFIIINSTEIHSFSATPYIDYYCILIFPEFFTNVDFDTSCLIQNKISGDEYIINSFSEMGAEYYDNTKESDMMIKGKLYCLMAYLLRNYKCPSLTQKDFDLYDVKLKRMNELLEYISIHYQEKITTKDLTKLCYLSESHLCRFFKSMTGKTVVNYINEYRTEKASVMIVNTDETITSIAANVGFDDMNYFSRVFKKIKGLSPIEYRSAKQNTK